MLMQSSVLIQSELRGTFEDLLWVCGSATINRCGFNSKGVDAANVNLLNYRLKLIRDHSELARSKVEEQTGTPDQLTRSAVRPLLHHAHSIAESFEAWLLVTRSCDGAGLMRALHD